VPYLKCVAWTLKPRRRFSDGFTKRLESALNSSTRNSASTSTSLGSTTRHPAQTLWKPGRRYRHQQSHCVSGAQSRQALLTFHLLRRLVRGIPLPTQNGQHSGRLSKAPSQDAGRAVGLLLPPESKSFSSMARSARDRRIFTRNCVASSCKSVTSPGALLDKQRHSGLYRTLNFSPVKVGLARLRYNTFLDTQLCDSFLECHRGHLRLDDYYVKVLTLRNPPRRASR